MGPSGAGKSNVSTSLPEQFPVPLSTTQFIDVATKQDGHTVGHNLESKTSDIRAVRVAHPITGSPVVLVDTPGFDDSSKSDEEILTMIVDWLVGTCVYGVVRRV
jgi:predicted GTPase